MLSSSISSTGLTPVEKAMLLGMARYLGYFIMSMIAFLFTVMLIRHLDSQPLEKSFYLNATEITIDKRCAKKGRDGIVYLGTWKRDGNELVAIKENHQGDACNEIYMLRTLRCCKNVVSIFGVLKSRSKRHRSSLNLVLEWMNKGTLQIFREYMHIGSDALRLSNSQKEMIRNIVWQLLNALDCLKRHFIIHADFKLENILLNEFGTVKLADFGRAITVTRDDGYIVSPYPISYGLIYRAPEIYSQLPFSYSADIWALGMLIIELILPETPFERCTTESTLRILLRDHLFTQQKHSILNAIKSKWQCPYGFDLLMACMRPNPNERISPEQALKHPYFNNFQPTNIFTLL